MITLEGKPGFGTALRPEVLQRKDVHVEVPRSCSEKLIPP